MSDLSPRLNMPFIQPSQAQKHVTHNEAVRQLDTITQLTVGGINVNSPPAYPNPGDCLAIGPNPTGDWTGQAGYLATWTGGYWDFTVPKPGWRAWVLNDQALMVFDGSTWRAAQSFPDQIAQLGIGTSADSANRLAVASDATLLTHVGAGHQLKVNKASDADTASLLFQSNWTGKAEMGLSGSAAFSVKISADGVTWQTALTADPTSSTLSLDLPVVGAAVQSDATDADPAKLMRTGAFGVGAETVPALPGNDFGAAGLPSGFWTNSAAPSGAPRAYHGQMAMMLRGGADSFFQMAAIRQEDQLWFRRADTDGAPSDWREVIHSGNIVGPLDTPNSHAVIDSGSNANGEFIRFADGTQICRATLLAGPITASGSGSFASPFQTSALDWTLPAAFVDSSYQISGTAACVSAVPEGPRTALCLSGAKQRSATLVAGISATRISGAADADEISISIIAIGAWQ